MAIVTIPKAELIFFDVGHFNTSSELKSFLTYLKVRKAPVPLMFSHIECNGKLLDNLTLQENILIDIPSLYNQNNKSIEQLVKDTDNQHLLKLFNQIGNLDVYPREINSNKIKLILILKGLLKKSKYVFIDMPEHNLMDSQLKAFNDAINFNIKSYNQTVFVRTNLKHIFQAATRQIVRDHDGKFNHTTLQNYEFKEGKEDKVQIDKEGHLKLISFPNSKNQAA